VKSASYIILIFIKQIKMNIVIELGKNAFIIGTLYSFW